MYVRHRPLIKLVNITKRYGSEDAPFVLKGIDMEIASNDFVALRGVSGSGKTTLMNIIGLLDNPTAGNYYFNGDDISDMNDDSLSVLRNKRVGFIFQSFYLIPYLNVVDNVLLPRFYSGEHMGAEKERAVMLLDEFGMADKCKSKPSELSGGQQQRVAIARAMINNPDLILADEPTGQLDSATSQTIMEYIAKLPGKGRAVLLVTHDAQTAGFAHRTVYIQDGLLKAGEDLLREV
ncbi:MAG: ABC transporter ATP-binding protein [Deferribacteraceae bacterium]|jgi:putative ABC transport system ATP-binding protein|nr:ABC transporter ATP-binding protein [Deferribacteraceae bacterium]